MIFFVILGMPISIGLYGFFAIGLFLVVGVVNLLRKIFSHPH